MATTEERLSDLEAALAAINGTLAMKADRVTVSERIVLVESDLNTLTAKVATIEERLREAINRTRDLATL